ncbi:MAG: hypothetical protein WDO06_00340 [Actinomycetota bacterium]
MITTRSSSHIILDQRPYASGILIRNHDDEKVQEAMKIWHAQMMRYSRRDQLSTNAAIEMSGVDGLWL